MLLSGVPSPLPTHTVTTATRGPIAHLCGHVVPATFGPPRSSDEPCRPCQRDAGTWLGESNDPPAFASASAAGPSWRAALLAVRARRRYA